MRNIFVALLIICFAAVNQSTDFLLRTASKSADNHTARYAACMRGCLAGQRMFSGITNAVYVACGGIVYAAEAACSAFCNDLCESNPVSPGKRKDKTKY